jgi:hypothetical protein
MYDTWMPTRLVCGLASAVLARPCEAMLHMRILSATIILRARYFHEVGVPLLAPPAPRPCLPCPPTLPFPSSTRWRGRGVLLHLAVWRAPVAAHSDSHWRTQIHFAREHQRKTEVGKIHMHQLPGAFTLSPHPPAPALLRRLLVLPVCFYMTPGTPP